MYKIVHSSNTFLDRATQDVEKKVNDLLKHHKGAAIISSPQIVLTTTFYHVVVSVYLPCEDEDNRLAEEAAAAHEISKKTQDLLDLM